jgi:Effector-associated domain 2/TIR domain
MAHVFINYRSIDNPWGAAGIHEWLARRFSDHRFFRDCVSLDAGTHYPTAIMAELARADLLIAVIGPHWLSAADPVTGQRLIDRDGDWVRRELARAFRWHTPVLPVLLKDNPEDAQPPAPADLPEDIRTLATLQACDVSQRRLGADLEILAHHVHGILAETGITRPPPRMRVQIPRDLFYSLIDALEAVPCLATEHDRATLLSLLRPAIAGAIRYSPQRRLHTMNIVRTCLEYEGGLAEMLTTIHEMEGESIPARQLAAITRDLPPELRPA